MDDYEVKSDVKVDVNTENVDSDDSISTQNGMASKFGEFESVILVPDNYDDVSEDVPVKLGVVDYAEIDKVTNIILLLKRFLISCMSHMTSRRP
jgi:hypothetical protein